MKLSYKVAQANTYNMTSKHSKTSLKRPLKSRQTKIVLANSSLMNVKSITKCSPWGILHYFCPALSDNLSWKPFFGLFESGRFILKKSNNFHLKYPQLHKNTDINLFSWNSMTTIWPVDSFAWPSCLHNVQQYHRSIQIVSPNRHMHNL